jgi:bifunctional non-homologous end joining protein LigD
MGLAEYRKKRRFDKTPEPAGKVAAAPGPLRFVVQKHEATRLHYDFRLELDGVLKSWAVPKGPSMNPQDKRLAMQVEDHPLDYRTFEGTIPEGNYGAGTVMVWDEGAYEPGHEGEADDSAEKLRDGLERGRLTFRLHGKKLRGAFSLIRMARGKGNEWLLIKKQDSFATSQDIREKDRSVLSRRTMQGIAKPAAGKEKVWHSSRPSRRTKRTFLKPSPSAAPKKRRGSDARPRDVRPMLATLVDEPFDRAGWLFEVKWDGYRAIAEVDDRGVRLYSRNLISFEDRYTPVVESLRALGHEAVLDGEIVVVDAKGRPGFQLLQTYQKSGKGNILYYVFDLLYLDGEDLRNQPLSRRKELLQEMLPELPHVRLGEHIERDGIAFFQAAEKEGLEGIIAKRADSSYREGRRSRDWLKIKIRRQQEAVIGGFTQPRGQRKEFGALVLGVYEGDDLVYVGHTGGGFSERLLSDVRAKLEPLVRDTCPFKKKPATNAPARWVEPKLVCEVVFHEWTGDGAMRQPIFLGLREDKPAKSVHREKALDISPTGELAGEPKRRAKKSRRAAKRGGRGEGRGAREANGVFSAHAPHLSPLVPQPALTNLNKVYWPEDDYTKGDLIGYYREVAPFILPHLKDRPLSLHRHPNGIRAPSFFQKDMGRQPPPAWVETVTIHSDTERDITYMLCQDEPSLLYMANLGCIEINPWNSRVATPDKPDYLVIDLDPEDIGFPQVVEAALAVRGLLERTCADGYCKTSGKRGLHIYIPLGARYDYAPVRQFGEIVARMVHQKLPKTTSIVRNPAQRQGRVYLDYLQNSRGQTLAAPYSVRPLPGAPVSTPLKWSEVSKRLDPTRYTIKTLPRRLEKVGDLWQPVLGAGADLERCVEELAGRA